MRLPTWITPTRFVLFAIVLVAIALRLTHLGAWPPGLYPDEAANGNDALQALAGSPQLFYPANNGREGLFINLQALALWVIGLREPWVLRLVSALAGILTVPGMYLLGKELWNRRVGLVASALLAGSFWHVTFSRVGFRAILAPLVLTYAVWALVAGIRRIRARQAHGWILSLLGGGLAGLGLHTYIAFRAAGLVFVATGIALVLETARTRRARAWKGLVAAGIAALVVAAPLLAYFATHPGSFSGRASQVSAFQEPHPAWTLARNVALEAGALVVRGDANWRHNDSGRPQIPFPWFVLFVAGAVTAATRLARARGNDVPGIALVSMLAAGIAPAVISDEGMPHALRSIMAIVPVILLMALGTERAWTTLERRGWHRLGIALAAGICAYGVIGTAIAYPRYMRKPEVSAEFSASYLEAGRALLRRDLARPAYVIVPDGDTLIHGVPVAAQTSMFVSGIATPEQQERADVRYATTTEGIPANAQVFDLRQ